MVRSSSLSATQAAFATGTAALLVPHVELCSLRGLIPRRSVNREQLGAMLSQFQLTNGAFCDALFELCDFTNIGTTSSVEVLTTYATLRRLATTTSADATAAALYLAFLSAGGSEGTLSFDQWSRFAGEIGISVGGVDCLPCEEAEANLRRRWRLTKGRALSIIGNHLTYDKFVALMDIGDTGVLECMRAIGFVLTHAVIDFVEAPVEKPTWSGDSSSCFLSQYMTYAIEKANMSTSSIEPPAATARLENQPDESDMQQLQEVPQNEEDSDALDEWHLNDNTKDFDSGNDLPPKPSPFPDVQVSNSRRPESSILTIGAGTRHHVSLGRTEGDSARTEQLVPSPDINSASSKSEEAVSIVRRARNLSGKSPFHIDFSALQLGERIGSGAYGDVYRGTFLMSPVAIKMFHVNVARSAGSGPGIYDHHDEEDPSCMSRMMSMTALQRFASVNSQAKYKNFLREVEMMSVVRHPNLVLYMGACGDPVTPLCIVSELFTGGSLYEYLHDEDSFRPSVLTSIHFALSIARGMFYLHSSQPSILHRDLKSRNVLLAGRKGIDGHPHVVICDFGLCQLFGEDGGSGTNSPMGTASYMAPDVINGEKYEAADDVYSYGILLHEIFTGCVPYKGSRAMQVMFGVSSERRRPSCRWDSTIPKVIRDLIRDCWGQERAHRLTFDKIIERLTEIEQSPP